MADFHIDPEFAALIPTLDRDSLAALEDTVRRDGCLDPLIVWKEESVLLDGHHRFEICKRHKIPYKTRLISLPSREDAVLWVLQHQLARRNLTMYQRAELALRMQEMFAQLGKAHRLARIRSGASSDDPANLPNSAKSPDTALASYWDTRKKVADIAGVSGDTIHRVKKISENATEELRQATRSGEISIAAAYELAGLTPEQQRQALKAGPRAAVHTAAAKRAERLASSPTSNDAASIIQQAARAALDLERRPALALHTLVQVWNDGLRAPGYGPGDCVSRLDRLTSDQRDLILRYLGPMQAWLKHAVDELQPVT